VLSRSRPRFFLQAGFLIAVAVIAAAVHLDAWAIAVAMAAAFGVVAVSEWVVQREATDSSQSAPPPGPARQTEVPATRNRTTNVPAAVPEHEEYTFIRHLREAAGVVRDMSDDVDGFLRKSFLDRRVSK
jgi:hypothetical protein